MNTSDLYFPGRDFPDREVWLKIRNTPRNLWKRFVRTFYNPCPVDDKGNRLPHKSYFRGFNAAKRGAKLADDPRAAHQTLVRARHAYYHRRRNGDLS